MKTFATEDGHLAYRDAGAGRPVVLLHAGFTDHRMWDDQVPALAGDYRVIAPDTRGHGQTSNATRPFRQTDDLAALLRHLDLGPAVLVGISMGAGIAVDTAIEHPDLVHALVISGAGTSEPTYDDPWIKEVLAKQEQALATGDIDGWIDAWLLCASGPRRKLDDFPSEILGRLHEMVSQTLSKHTADETNFLVPVTDTWARAAKISVPVLAISGDLDSPDLIGMAERLAHSVADGRTAVVEGTAHYPNMEGPDAYNQILRDFLAEVI